MMMHIMTEARFMSGIQGYVRRFANQSVDQDDLFDVLNSSIRGAMRIPEQYSLDDIMEPWTKQAGFPLITVTRDYDNGTATFTQVIRLS
jgi:aminopeptidase N